MNDFEELNGTQTAETVVEKSETTEKTAEAPVPLEKMSGLLSESDDLSNDMKVADEASDQPQPSSSRDGDLFARTMITLSRSEVFSSFLKSKLDESRNSFSVSKKENQNPNKKKNRKRQADDSDAAATAPFKKSKTADGTAADTSNETMKRSERQPKLLEGAVLRDYQLEGFDWLVALDLSGASGILADEMGLGKTIQVIALISFLIEVGSAEAPFLIICPLSTVANWENEFKRFAPKIPVVVYYGSKECRAGLRRELRREHFVDGLRTYPVVITSYSIPIKERVLRGISWRYVIIDEGHRIKNHECLLIKELRLYKTINRLLLTGTPLQNNLTELWSLLNFCMPDVIDDQYVFESWFSDSDVDVHSEKILEAERQNQVLSTLHKILKPFVLRRVKADVDLNLPSKRELIVYAPLTPMQMELYDYVVKKTLNEAAKNGQKDIDESKIIHKKRGRPKSSKLGVDEEVPVFDEIEDDHTGSKDPALTKALKTYIGSDEEMITSIKYSNPVMALRKICQHPYLTSFPVIPGTRSMQIDERLVTRSGKMQVLDALLKRLRAGGHKVLIFSNFTVLLDLLEEYMCLREYKYCRLDGSRGLEDRRENINTFNDDSETFAFLISTRAGGLGINLVSADTVIIFDSDWNPQADLQAQDRCHRIGQTKDVVVYRLVAGGTVDEKLVERAEGKMRLDRLVINHGKFKSIKKDVSLTTQELENLLVFKERIKINRSNTKVFSNEELDMLCDRKALFSSGAKMSQGGVFKVVQEELPTANSSPQESNSTS